MTNPQPAPGRKTPRRAEPLQPDAPTSGDEAESTDADTGSGTTPPEKELEAKEQLENSQRNVREGYK